jgi:selenocysteine lyase/cysteine desulfurase
VQAAEAVGATVRWTTFDTATSELDEVPLTGRTRLVAVTCASKLLGTRPDIPGIAARVHDAGALLYVDGVHLTPHAPVDVRSLGADFYACSPYQFLGPHCGVLAASPDPARPAPAGQAAAADRRGTERFELGTLPYELLVGTTATVDFLAGLVPGEGSRRDRVLASMTALEEAEDAVRARLKQRLSELPGVRMYGHAARRTPTLLFSVDGRDSAAVSDALAAEGVNAPAGSFYALEASRRLGLADTGAVRAGIAPYTDDSDVDRLVAAVANVVKP